MAAKNVASSTFITATDAGGPAEEKKDLKKLGSKARAFGGTFRRMTIQSCQMVFDAAMPVVILQRAHSMYHAHILIPRVWFGSQNS